MLFVFAVVRLLTPQGDIPRVPNRRPTAESDEAPAPWSAHAPATSPTRAEAVDMTLESVVPASVVPEVERLLKVCCCCTYDDVPGCMLMLRCAVLRMLGLTCAVYVYSTLL